MIRMARKDLRALEGMDKAQIWADEIFGFHAQQAAEKALKAWILALDDDAPRTHALNVLLLRLENLGQHITPFWDLVELQGFAVQFRYEEMPEDADPIPRPAMRGSVEALVNHVSSVLGDDS